MNTNLDNLFYDIKNTIFKLIEEKEINKEDLLFSLGIDNETFEKNFTNRKDDFTFYLNTLSIVENWEE